MRIFDVFKAISWHDVAHELSAFAPVIAAALDDDPETVWSTELKKVIAGYADATPLEVKNILRSAKKSDPALIKKLKEMDPEIQRALEAEGVNVSQLLLNSNVSQPLPKKKIVLLTSSGISLVVYLAYKLIHLWS